MTVCDVPMKLTSTDPNDLNVLNEPNVLNDPNDPKILTTPPRFNKAFQ